MAATGKNPGELEKASKLAHVPKGEEYEKMISGMLYVSPVLDPCILIIRRLSTHCIFARQLQLIRP